MSPVPTPPVGNNPDSSIRFRFKPFSLEEQRRIRELYVESRWEEIKNKNTQRRERLAGDSPQKASRIPKWLKLLLVLFTPYYD